jgi:hypothetical protein
MEEKLALQKEILKYAPNLWKKVNKNNLKPIKENGTWRPRYNREHYKWSTEPDIVKEIKGGWLSRLAYLFRV